MRRHVCIQPGDGIRRLPIRVCVLALACTCVLAAAALHAAPALAAAPLSWSSPESVDVQQEPLGLRSVTCPTSSLCVGGDSAGDIVSSTDPLAASPSWEAVTVPGAGVPINGISCASPTLCVAVGWASVIPIGGPPPPQGPQILSSTDPTGGGAAWNVASVDGPEADGTTALDSVSCVDSLCVAGGSGSNSGAELAVSTDPTGGAADWNVFSVAPASWFVSGVSCVSTSLCVAVDSAGDVLTSTDPTGGPSAWAVTHIAGESGFVGVSCPAASLCVAVDALGNVVTSANPTGGAGAWTVTSGTDPDPYGFEAVSCASATVCAAVDEDGDVVSASDPTGGESAWSSANVADAGALSAVSCVPGSSACVAGGEGVSPSDDAVIDSTDATGGAGAWSAYPNPGGVTTPSGPHNTIEGMSCITGPLCVGVDDAGNIIASTDPQAGASAWQMQAAVDGTTQINAVSCIAGPLCVAVDDAGDVLSSTDPTGGPGAWTVTDVDGSTPITTVTCVSGPICIAGAQGGIELSSTDPTGGAGAWTTTTLGAKSWSMISCPSAALCVALNGSDGHVITSTDPLGGAGAWQDEGELSADAPTGISCPTSDLCVVVDAQGNVLTTSDPFGANGSTWTAVAVDPSTRLTAVTCESATLCVASDASENTLATNDPSGPASAWTATNTQESADTISCVSATLCVAAGPYGVVETATAAASDAELSVELAGNGAGTVSADGTSCSADCTASFPSGSVVTLTASPAPGSTFAGWSGGRCSGTSACTITVAGDLTVMASFFRQQPPLPSPSPSPSPSTTSSPVPSTTTTGAAAASGSLAIDFGGSGHGQVSGDGVSCVVTCTEALAQGVVTLTATPASGARFTGWGGACSGVGTCSLTLAAAASVTANFAELAPSATVRGLDVRRGTVVVHLAWGGGANRLEYALVRERAGAALHPAYRSCGEVLTLTHLRAGAYVLYVRAVAADGKTSRPLVRRISIR